MARKEPSSAALYAARLAKAYPTLSAYSAASLARELCSIERAQRTHATRQCNGPRDPLDGPNCPAGYVKLRPLNKGETADRRLCPAGMTWEHDPVAGERAGRRIARQVNAWRRKLATLHQHAYEPPRRPQSVHDGIVAAKAAELSTITLQDDPRGRVLLLQLPGEADAS